MAATDKLRRASNGTQAVPTSFAAPKANGATTATIAAATGWPTATGVDVVAYLVDTSGAKVANSQATWVAQLTGTTLSGMVLRSGTEPATGYPGTTASVVTVRPTAAWANDLVDWGTAQHNQDGSHAAVTATSLSVSGASTFTGTATFNGTVTGLTPAKLQNPYKFSAYLSSTTGGNATAFPGSKISYDTELFDTGNNFDTTTNKGRFTAPIAGFYSISAGFNILLGSGNSYFIELYKNGTSFKRGTQSTISATFNVEATISEPCIQLAAGDYLEVYAIASATSTLVTGNAPLQTYFSGFLVSQT